MRAPASRDNRKTELNYTLTCLGMLSLISLYNQRALKSFQTATMKINAKAATIITLSWMYSSLQFAVIVFGPFITIVADGEVEVESLLHPSKTFWTMSP